MYTPFKMKGKSPMVKKLIGNQNRLPEHLKAKIEAAPESPSKMKKASMAKLKKSAAKIKKSGQSKPNKFSAEYRNMTPSQRRRVYGEKVTGSKTQTDKKRAEGKAKFKSKLSKDIGSVTSKLDKAIQGFFNNPRGKQKTGENKYVAPEKSVKTNTTKKKTNQGGFTSRKGDPYLYRKNNDGTFTTKKGKDGKEITVKKGNKGFDAISSVFKLKKKSAAKMKKAPAKMMKKSPTTLKKKVKK